MPRPPFRSFLPLLLLTCGLALFGTAAQVRGSNADTPATIVEEVRTAQIDGRIVERRVLIDTSLSNDPAALADDATGIPRPEAGVSAQFALNPWKWPLAAMPVTVALNRSLEAPRPSLEPALLSAIQQWSAVSPDTFAFTYLGTTTATGGACDNIADGVNVVGYVTTLRQGVLGMTCSFRNLDAPDVTVEFDMELNWTVDWGAGPTIGASQYDVASTVLHEMGHAAGLGHTNNETAVMWSKLGKDQIKRTLQPDDIAGLRAQYPRFGAYAASLAFSP